MKNKVLVIVGPTCTGKTTLALKLASKLNGVLVSADSRQLVKGMDFGTGKIKSKDEDTKRIFGYDLINPDETFTAFDFKNYAESKITEISSEGKLPILVGGTGFYVDVVTGKVKLDSSGRDLELRKVLSEMSTEQLAQKLFEADVAKLYVHKIDLKNKVRIIRAIEKLSVGGADNKEAQEHLEDNLDSWGDSYDFILVGLTSSRENLYLNSDSWLDETWGLIVDETRGLLSAGYGESAFLKGFIYKSAVEYLNGGLSFDEALVRAKFDTHAYIRRQQTWFKRNKEIVWFDISTTDLAGEVEKLVEKH